MEPNEEARPPNGESPEGQEPRDLRRERLKLRKKLTPKQRKYLRALRANSFQKWSTARALGFSENSVFKWLRQDDFKAALALEEELDELDSDLTRQQLIAAYKTLAFADIRRLYDESGNLLPPQDWPDDIAATIESVETVERKLFEKDEHVGFEYVRKVRRHNRKHALDFLAELKKVAAPKRFEVTGKDGMPIQGPPVIHFVERSDDDVDQN